MKVLIQLFFLFFSLFFLHAQEGSVWNTYQAKQEKGVSSTNVRMDLIEKAPINGFDFLLYVKIKYKVTEESDFPVGNKLKKLYKIKDAIYDKMQSVAESHYVGSFMFDGNRFEYYYVKDASGIEEQIDKLFKSTFKTEKYEVYVKADVAWDLYTNFLYPNDEIKNFMSNRDTVIQLKNAGDISEYPRKIEHFASFASKNDCALFMADIEKLSYTIDSQKTIEEAKYPYEVKFYKEATTTMESISEITTTLMELSKKYYGAYDGWETYVVKEE